MDLKAKNERDGGFYPGKHWNLDELMRTRALGMRGVLRDTTVLSGFGA